ncbi:hypothetical protein V2G26_003927 [Clonostachys chloroleuca]
MRLDEQIQMIVWFHRYMPPLLCQKGPETSIICVGQRLAGIQPSGEMHRKKDVDSFSLISLGNGKLAFRSQTRNIMTQLFFKLIVWQSLGGLGDDYCQLLSYLQASKD